MSLSQYMNFTQWDLARKFLARTLTFDEKAKFKKLVKVFDTTMVDPVHVHDNSEYIIVKNKIDGGETIYNIYNKEKYIAWKLAYNNNNGSACASVSYKHTLLDDDTYIGEYHLDDVLFTVPFDDLCRTQPNGERHSGTKYINFIIDFVREDAYQRGDISFLTVEDGAYTHIIAGFEKHMPNDIIKELRERKYNIMLSTLTWLTNGVSMYEQYGFNCFVLDPDKTSLTDYRGDYVNTVRRRRYLFLRATKSDLLNPDWFATHDMGGKRGYNQMLNFFTRYNALTHNEVTPDLKKARIEQDAGYISKVYLDICELCKVTLTQYLADDLERESYIGFLRERASLLQKLDIALRTCKILSLDYIYDLTQF